MTHTDRLRDAEYGWAQGTGTPNPGSPVRGGIRNGRMVKSNGATMPYYSDVRLVQSGIGTGR